jgi:hypothetical protein
VAQVATSILSRHSLFGRTCKTDRPRRLGSFSTLKMELVCSSETSVHIRTTHRCIPDGGNMDVRLSASRAAHPSSRGKFLVLISVRECVSSGTMLPDASVAFGMRVTTEIVLCLVQAFATGRAWPRGPTAIAATTQKKNKLHCLSPRANYTDLATAACRRSDCQLLRIEGATWSA